jgi:hypothetical protein
MLLLLSLDAPTLALKVYGSGGSGLVRCSRFIRDERRHPTQPVHRGNFN